MKQINKNIIWNTIGNTAYNGLQWLITVLVTRKSGFSEAGILSLAMAMSLTFRAISYFGIRNFQITDKCNKYSDADYFSFRIITCIISFVMCAVCAILFGYTSEIFAAILLYMLFRVTEGFSDLHQGIMQKAERLDYAGICLLIKATVTTACFAIGYCISNSLNIGLAFMSASAIGVLFIFEIPITRRCSNGTLEISWTNCKKLAAETAPMFAYMTELSFIFNAPKWFLYALTDEASVGAFSSVFSLALIIHAVFKYLYVPYITEFSLLYVQKNYFTVKKLAAKIITIFASLVLLFSFFSLAFGSSVLTVIYGENEIYHEIILPVVLSVCAYSLMTFVSVFAIIERNFKKLIVGYTLGAIIFIVISPPLISLYGISGASYGMMLASTVVIGILASKYS